MRMIRNIATIAVGLLVTLATLVAPAGVSEAAPAGRLTLSAGRAITAQFSGTKLNKKRVVNLQRSADGQAWTTVTSVKMSSKGVASFGIVASDPGYYRAVAKSFSYVEKKKKKVSAEVVGETRQLGAPSFAEEFTGSALSEIWRSRDEVGYAANGRLCSAPVSRNTSVSGGSAVLKMTRVSASEATKVTADAKNRQRADNASAVKKADAAVTKAEAALAKAKAMAKKTTRQKQKRNAAIKKATAALTKAKAARSALTPGCPGGVYHNAMITTQGSDQSISAGAVVAKVKFVAGQGSHSGIWLQAANRQEIDVIEAYGYGRGVTNVIHRLSGSTLKKDPKVDKDAYVAVNTVKSKSWWSRWHTVAVSFDDSTISFYLDGVKTRQLKGMRAADYRLVLSVLSSDWETYRVKKPDVRPGSGVKKSSVKKQKGLPSMSVDWIRIWKKA
ncbi:MAG: glycoside hydrolase family 16 protein [Micropruina sp.]